MTTLREAAQQALEALEFSTLDAFMLAPISPGRESTIKAITALRAALAEPVECQHGVTDGNCKECYEAKAEPVQVTGAWMYENTFPKEYSYDEMWPHIAVRDGVRRETMTCPSCEYNKQRAQLWRHEAYKLGGHPLDWEPELMVRPKPLTDDEVVALFNRLCKERSAYPERRYRDFARWVEAAHGIGEKK